jgi:hypothetical protein
MKGGADGPCHVTQGLFRALIEEALQLRRLHLTWGAGLVRVLLHRDYPVDPIPAQRTLG